MNKNETFESIYVKNMNNLDLKVNSSKNILYKDAPLHITGGTIIEKDLYLGGSLQIGNKIITPKIGETQYEGMIYYDSTEKTLKLFSNDAFRTIVTNDWLDVELEENMNINTTGTITASEIKTATISNKTTNKTIVINDSIKLESDKSITLQGTGAINTNGIITTSSNFIAVGGNLITGGGEVVTNTISPFLDEQNLKIKCDLEMDSNKNLSLDGTGVLSTDTGNIECGATLKTNTIEKYSGTEININDNITVDGVVIFLNLPSSNPGVVNQVYNDGGTLKIHTES